MGLVDALPAPQRTQATTTSARRPTTMTTTTSAITLPSVPSTSSIPERHAEQKRPPRPPHIPPYGQRAIDAYSYSNETQPKTDKRSKKPFIPRTDDDFGGGGAYPEIHFAQYPLGMGRRTQTKTGKSQQNSTASTQQQQQQRDAYGRSALAVRSSLTEGTKTPFDVVVNLSGDARKQTRHSAMVPRRFEEEDLARPDDSLVEQTVAETQRALEALTETRLRSSAPQKGGVSQFMLYTPVDQQQQVQQAGAPASKLVKLTTSAVDPILPPKHKIRKAVRVNEEEPAPVMHSPQRKLTAADHAAWKIPPCVSLWKNNMGYTIPLHTRLAADGRHLEEHSINPRFEGFADSLYAAEHAAREEVRTHAEVEARIASKKKQEQEARLDELARKVYAEVSRDTGQQRTERIEGERPEYEESDEYEDEAGRRERESIRRDMQKEREREIRLQRAGRGGQLEREKRRDVSERVALGGEDAAAGAPGVGKSSDALFDARLFNKTSGMGAGLGDEESYNVYSEPLFAGAAARNALYKRTGASTAAEYGNDADWAALQDTSRFQPSRGFSGAGGAEVDGGAVRDSGPVQFERAQTSHALREPEDERRRAMQQAERQRERQREIDEGDDPFGLNEFHTEVTGRRGADGVLSRIGRGGQMSAASAGGTGGGGDQAAYLREGGSKRSHIEFASSGRDDKRQRR